MPSLVTLHMVAALAVSTTLPDRLAFDLITDLEPYLAAIESPDSEVVKARVRSLAGQHPRGG